MIIALHKKLQHQPFSSMAKCIENDTWYNVPSWLTAAAVRQVDAKSQCLVCAVGNTQNRVHSIGTGISPKEVGSCISIDCTGPYNPPGMYGCKYAFIVACLSTGYLQVYMSKSKLGIYKALDSSATEYFRYGHVTKSIRVDSGSVEGSADFLDYTSTRHLVVQQSPPRGQSSNPVERYIQTLKKMMITLLLSQSTLARNQWCSALNAAATSWNERVNSLSAQHRDGMSPYECVTGSKPDMLQIMNRYAFGDLVIFKKSVAPGPLEQNNDVGAVVGNNVTNSLVVYPGSMIPKPRKILAPFTATSPLPSRVSLQEALDKNVFNADGSVTIYTNDTSIDFSDTVLSTHQQSIHDDPELESSIPPDIVTRRRNGPSSSSTPSDSVALHASTLTVDSASKYDIHTCYDECDASDFVTDAYLERAQSAVVDAEVNLVRKVRSADNPSWGQVSKKTRSIC